MTTENLRTDLRLLDLAARVPCYWGTADCRCDGCRARAALGDADGYLAKGALLDAYLKAGHADYLVDWEPIRTAYERLGVALAESPDAMTECPRCRAIVPDELTVAVHRDPDSPADNLCQTCAADVVLCPAELMAAWRRMAQRAVAS